MWWTVERNVQAGARLLDEVLPGWHRFVCRCELDAMNIHKDVLGQMFCDSIIGFQMIIKQSHTLQCGESYRPSEFGFLLPKKLANRLVERGAEEFRQGYDVLTLFWLAEINRRLHFENVYYGAALCN